MSGVPGHASANQKAWVLITFIVIAGIVAGIGVMASCSVKESRVDSAVCVAEGGKWIHNPVGVASYTCAEPAK